VDIRHEPQKIDLEFMEWMGENAIPFCIVFTKADKLRPKAIENHIDAYIKDLLAGIWEEAPQYFITSSSNDTGREELLHFIDDLNEKFIKEIQNNAI
jgi:GTP-binding protein